MGRPSGLAAGHICLKRTVFRGQPPLCDTGVTLLNGVQIGVRLGWLVLSGGTGHRPEKVAALATLETGLERLTVELGDCF